MRQGEFRGLEKLKYLILNFNEDDWASHVVAMRSELICSKLYKNRGKYIIKKVTICQLLGEKTGKVVAILHSMSWQAYLLVF